MPDYRLRRLSGSADLSDAHSVRRTVFVEGQGVPEHLEVDGRDGEAVHVLALEGDRPVATGRLRPLDDSTGKVERVAVLPAHRGEGLGRRVMAELEDLARERRLDTVVLHAQTDVEGFYADLGYESVGEEFEEAGIPHVEMRKSLDSERP